MFTGIVEELGQVGKITQKANCRLLEIFAHQALQGVKVGDSISVNGACLTIVKISKESLFFEVMPETLALTNLGSLRLTDKVNLERSLKVGDRISGHFVTGHVDCQGLIRKKNYLRGNLCFEIAIPPQLAKYCITKGSIAVDGISLTVAKKTTHSFSVYIIPHTLNHTTLSLKGPSHKVNIEFDLLLKKEF